MSSLENDPIRNLPVVTTEPPVNRSAASWQVLLTAVALVAIVTIFFWGINNQRDETAGEQTAATMPASVAPQSADAKQDTKQDQPQGQQQAGQQQPQQPPSTTGQGSGNDKNGDRKDQPQTSAQKANGQPAGGNRQPAHPQSK